MGTLLEPTRYHSSLQWRYTCGPIHNNVDCQLEWHDIMVTWDLKIGRGTYVADPNNTFTFLKNYRNLARAVSGWFAQVAVTDTTSVTASKHAFHVWCVVCGV